jgi:DNA-binding MarR family transcriptional regulator
MKRIRLPQEQALVLQQINERGEEDFTGLAEGLRIGRAKLAEINQILHHKRLILVRKSSYAEVWVRLSAKGQQVMRTVWPESAGPQLAM